MTVRNCAALSLAALLLLSTPAVAKKTKRPKADDVTNFVLGFDYSHWMVGPISYLATEAEVEEFLRLDTDEAAAQFVKEFWKRRDPDPDMFGNEARTLFETRAEKADRLYRENAMLGRRTDRGMVFVVYGKPESIGYDIGVGPRDPDLEVWSYPGDSPAGLDGSRPKKLYWFAEKGGRTVFHVPKANRRSSVPR